MNFGTAREAVTLYKCVQSSPVSNLSKFGYGKQIFFLSLKYFASSGLVKIIKKRNYLCHSVFARAWDVFDSLISKCASFF